MTPISSTTSSTALSILQNMKSAKGAVSDSASTGMVTVLGPLETTSTASKQAAEKVAAILKDAQTIDLSAYGLAKASVTAENNATITTGDGNASVEALDHATLYFGSGNDYSDVQNYATIHAGAGNDVLRAYSHATVDAGDGNDWVHVYDHAAVEGGAGDDQIRTYDYSTVDAGDGDDFVVTLGNSTIDGGAGNDTLVVSSQRSEETSTFDNATVDGGDGDDYIQVNGNSTVSGGTGNDTIRVFGDGTTVNFAKGDGQDAIWIGKTDNTSWANTTVNISGYSAEDASLTQNGSTFTLTFKDSDDSLSFQFERGSAHVAFDDGTSLDVTPNNNYARLQEVQAFVDAPAGEAKPALFDPWSLR